MISKNSKDY